MRCVKYIEGFYIKIVFLKWFCLIVFFYLDNGVEFDVYENGCYEMIFQEFFIFELFYKFYFYLDDIGRGRSVSQYFMQNVGREGVNGFSVCNNVNIRMFFGMVLFFSLVGIVVVVVIFVVFCEYMCCYIVYKV